MGSAEWLRMYAQRLEDEHAPHNLSIGMREAADQMDQQRETTLQLLGQVGQLSDELERLRAALEVTSSDCKEAFAENESLRLALKDARVSVEGWADYASDYIKKKWDLKGDLARIDAALEGK